MCLLLFQYSCLHFLPTTLSHPIVMVKAEYGEINVCMIMWLGLSHMKKVTQCKRMDCHGMCRLYWWRPGEAFACWMKTRTRIRQCLLICQNEIQIQSPRKNGATWEKWGRGLSHLHIDLVKTHWSNNYRTDTGKASLLPLYIKKNPCCKI